MESERKICACFVLAQIRIEINYVSTGCVLSSRLAGTINLLDLRYQATVSVGLSSRDKNMGRGPGPPRRRATLTGVWQWHM